MVGDRKQEYFAEVRAKNRTDGLCFAPPVRPGLLAHRESNEYLKNFSGKEAGLGLGMDITVARSRLTPGPDTTSCVSSDRQRW